MDHKPVAPAVAAPLNLNEYEGLARNCLSSMVYDYYAGGAEDELTIADNLSAWSKVKLRPRVLVDVSQVDTATTILGQSVSMPVLTAPCAFNTLAHPEGECAVSRAAARAGIIQVVSTMSTRSVEDIASAASGPRWFQLYCYRDREITRSLVQRAEASGYSALCLTVDVPFLGRREREVRHGFHLPAGATLKNLEPYARADMGRVSDGSALASYVGQLWDSSLTWDGVDWLRSISRIPLVIKGVLTGDDARLAFEHGATGIIVSNHGGRQLDGSVSTCAALAEVVDAVQGRGEVLVDGGIRRGVDVIKALAIGARAVLIGRPYLWALAVNGEAGVDHMLELLKNEIALAMALTGRATIASIDPALVAR